VLGCPVRAGRARPLLRLRRARPPGTRLRRLGIRRLGTRRVNTRSLLLRRLLLRRLLLRRLGLQGLATRPGVSVGRRQGFGSHRPELAEPLFRGEVGAIVRLLAIVPPPAHRLPPHRVPRSSLAPRTESGARPKLRPTGQRSHAREGAATHRLAPIIAVGRALAWDFSRRVAPEKAPRSGSEFLAQAGSTAIRARPRGSQGRVRAARTTPYGARASTSCPSGCRLALRLSCISQ
jgi:hypothetical protein